MAGFPTIVPLGDLHLDAAKQFAQHVQASLADESGRLQAHGSYYADPNFDQDLARYRDRVNQLQPGLGDFAAAQARLETGDGRKFSTPFNFGNINNTDSNPKGGGGFANPEQAADAYVGFLTNNGGPTRYQALLDAAQQGADVGTLAHLAKQAGYATDPDYAAKVAAIAGEPPPTGPSAAEAFGQHVQQTLQTGPAAAQAFGQHIADTLGGLKDQAAQQASDLGQQITDNAKFLADYTGLNAPPPTPDDNGGDQGDQTGPAAAEAFGQHVGDFFNGLGTNIHNAPGPLGQLAGAAGDVADTFAAKPGRSPLEAAGAPIKALGQVANDLNPLNIGTTLANDVANAEGVTPAQPASFPVVTGAANLAGMLVQPGGILPGAGQLGEAVTQGAAKLGQALPGEAGSAVSNVALGRMGVPKIAGAAPPPAAPGSPLQDLLDAANQEVQAPGVVDKVKSAAGDLETQLSDRLAAVNRIGPRSEAAASALQGKTAAAVQRATDAMKPVYDLVPSADDQALLNGKLMAERDIEKATVTGNANRATGGTSGIADAQAKLSALNAAMTPDQATRVNKAADMVRTSLAQLRDEMAASGIITQDAAADWAKNQPNYVPTHILDYLEKNHAAPGAGPQITLNSSGIRRLTKAGSDKQQMTPLTSALKAIVDGDQAIRTNDAVRTLVEEGGFKTTNPHSLVTGVDIGSGDLATVATRRPRTTTGYLSFMQDGKRMLAAVPSDVERAAKWMTTDQLQGWQKIVSGMNQSLRLGATALNPAFLATNAIRDYATAGIREGISPVADIKGMIEGFRQGPLYKQYIEAGGGMGGGGSFQRTANTAVNYAKLERQVKGSGGSVARTMADVAKAIATLEPVRKVGEAVELGPRLATFQKHLAAGETAQQAVMAGRRSTVDFSRAGQAVRDLNAIAPFLNARVQGTLTVGRTLRDSPQARVRLSGLLAGMIGAYLWNRQFPEYADVPDYVKQNSVVIMLPGSEKNPTGPGYKSINYIALPIGEWGAFGVPLKAALQAIDGQRPDVLDTLSQTVNAANPLPGGSIPAAMGNFLPPVMKTGAEVAMNKDFFRNRDIVPESESRLPPELQYGSQTSEVAKRLGATLNVSPRDIDHIIAGVAGGGGRLGTQAISQGLGQESDRPPVAGGLLGGVVRNYGGQVQQDAYDNRDKGLVTLQRQNRDMYVLMGASGHPLGGPDSPPPASVSVSGVKVPLYPIDQLHYAQIRDSVLQQVLATPEIAEAVRTTAPEERSAMLGRALTLADARAKQGVLTLLPPDERVRRAQAQLAAPPKAYRTQDVSQLRFSAPPA